LSVLNKGYSKFDYIIIDGDSIAGRVEIMHKYERWPKNARDKEGNGDALPSSK
jgi:hypothetical protein